MAGVAVAAAAVGALAARALPGGVQKKEAREITYGRAREGADVAADPQALADNIGYHAKFTAATAPLTFETPQAYRAVAGSVAERLVERWDATTRAHEEAHPKMGYYLSMEYLHGRTLANAVRNLDLQPAYAGAVEKFGQELEALEDAEKDAALGNGGLGRLASCFLDSVATMDLPVWGYGLRYKYGLFKQLVSEAGQREVPEDWLDASNPWEVRRDSVAYNVRFGGKCGLREPWMAAETAIAVAHDVPIPGYRTDNTISLRLWGVDQLSGDFDLEAFNAGDHLKAQEAQIRGSELCAVLYPGDTTPQGEELRLRQQYLLCSASVQDIVARFKAREAAHSGKVNWKSFPKKVAIQMNDTHPTLAAPELMRILMDEEKMTWGAAWAIVTETCNYTNHTVLPEALEKWPLELMDRLLPRHMEIIRRIDKEFIASVKAGKGESREDLAERVGRMQVLEGVDPATQQALPGEDAKVRMANLCVIAARCVNGVAALHSEIIKEDVFNDFYELTPEKFQNKTNGVTPRRFLAWCNPWLSGVITKWLGSDAWVKDLSLLAGLKEFKKNEAFKSEWKAAHEKAKQHMAAYIKKESGYDIPIASMVDVQVKRIHEYKRQLLNIMAVIYRYKKLKEMPRAERQKQVPKSVLIGGKAFATYVQAKSIVALICAVADTVNNDPEIGDLLKVVMLPNYNVTVAENVIPGADVCQQISTAGMEASGTSNMKFMMNGALTVGTLDGANVEIREEVGAENFFLFGATAEEIPKIREARAGGEFVPDPRLVEVKDYIRSKVFGGEDFDGLLCSLEGNEGYGRGDYFCVGHDFPSYLEALDRVDALWKDQDAWVEMSIMQTACSGKFSSDRTIGQYAEEIWGVEAVPVSLHGPPAAR